MSSSSNSKSNKNNKRSKSSKNNLERIHPGQFKTNVEYNHMYRFYVSSNANTVITPTTLLGAMGTIGRVTNTSVTTICNSVRLNRVKIWGAGATTGTAGTSLQTVSVDWTGEGNTPSREVTDSSNSVTFPAFVDTRPPPQSLASFWQVASSTTLCTLSAPPGSLVEVHLTSILADGSPDSLGTTINVATAIVGRPYYLALDGPSTNAYLPIGLATTF
jgi:hypothetical protein